LQAMMALYGNSLPSMLFLIAHSCKDVLMQWCLAFLSDFAAHPEKVRPLLPVFKFILADPNFVAFGLGSHTKGTTNPNFEIMKLTPDTAFIPKCHGICARELDKIGVAGERMCAERGFVAALASVGQELQEIHGVRLDQVSVPVYPREYTFADPPSRIHLDEFTFINTPLLVHLHSFTFTNTHPLFAVFSLSLSLSFCADRGRQRTLVGVGESNEHAKIFGHAIRCRHGVLPTVGAPQQGDGGHVRGDCATCRGDLWRDVDPGAPQERHADGGQVAFGPQRRG